jgi:hypothetical protein
MVRRLAVFAAILVCVLGSYLLLAQAAQRGPGRNRAQAPELLSFFVTSVGMGDGGNLGGLAGADKHCQTLAQAAGGSSNKIWRAYLSTQASGNQPAVNARDRIGQGPWYNADGAMVAQNLADLHGEGVSVLVASPVNRAVALTEAGNLGGQAMLTGSQRDGRAYTDGMDHTCNNWTSNGAGSVQVGNQRGGGFGRGGAAGIPSWNSFGSRGCSQGDLGGGLFYCFAVN